MRQIVSRTFTAALVVSFMLMCADENAYVYSAPAKKEPDYV
jgi:hypothetical protein